MCPHLVTIKFGTMRACKIFSETFSKHYLLPLGENKETNRLIRHSKCVKYEIKEPVSFAQKRREEALKNEPKKSYIKR